MKQEDHWHMLKKDSKIVFTSNVVVSPGPLSPTPFTSSAMKTPENTEEDPANPELSMKEISKWKTPLICCTAQEQKQQQIITRKNLVQHRCR
jgi:hypothetical protein